MSFMYSGKYDTKYFMLALVTIISYSIFAELFIFYRSWRADSLKEILFYTFTSWAFTLFPIFTFLYFTKESDHFSSEVSGLWIIFTPASLYLWRVIFRHILFSLRRKVLNTSSIGVISLTKRGLSLFNEIEHHPEAVYKLTAIFDDRSINRIAPAHAHYYEDGLEQAIEMALKSDIKILFFFALPMSNNVRIDNVIKLLGCFTVEVDIIPDMFTYNLLQARMDHVCEIQTISVYDSSMKGASSLLKRLGDIALLRIIAIPMLIIAKAVKMTSIVPVIFKQNRYGMDGKKIKILKFRSMTTQDNVNIVKQITEGDAHITPLGALLLRTSVDELPSFLMYYKTIYR
jgi:putative colanic acid biosynthesis UDP-glucose lipid carrier transferase